MYRTVFWTLWERARVGWFGRMALKHVYYLMWNRLSFQILCMRQGAQGWCTGMTLRDGIVMGNTCTPMADWCECMAKPLQYCKLISLQLKWINLLTKLKFISKKKALKKKYNLHWQSPKCNTRYKSNEVCTRYVWGKI